MFQRWKKGFSFKIGVFIFAEEKKYLFHFLLKKVFFTIFSLGGGGRVGCCYSFLFNYLWLRRLSCCEYGIDGCFLILERFSVGGASQHSGLHSFSTNKLLRVWFPAFSIFSGGFRMSPRLVNSTTGLRKSRQQRLYYVNWSNLVLASGKIVLQK